MAFDSLWGSIKYLATPIPRHLKAMGYGVELSKLETRGTRCQAAWRHHVECTRSVILEAAGRRAERRTVLIIGSGLLFDIPLAELSRQFRAVILVDIFHPWKVRKEARRYPNVRLQQLDVTGVLKEVYARARGGRALETAECKPNFFLDDEIDLVVSANILSQLAVLPNGYASRWIKKSNNGQIKVFSRRLVINHLDWMASFAGGVCLIADLERLYCDGDDVVSREGSLWGVDLPEGGREWQWDLAPRPEIELNQDVRHRVVGYAEFPKQVWLDRHRAAAKAGTEPTTERGRMGLHNI